MYQDQTLTCQDCTAEFVFSARDQEFFAQRNFTAPKRCRTCAKARRQTLHQETAVACAACGAMTTVPFQPRLDETGKPVKPVYCRACFDARRSGDVSGESAPVAQAPVSEAPVAETDLPAAA